MRKRVMRLWAVTTYGQLATDPCDRPTPYLFGERIGAEQLVECDEDRIQRVKVTIEAAGPSRKPRLL